MGYAVVVSVSAGGTTNQVVTGSVDTTGANLIIMVGATLVTAGTQFPSDSKSNTWSSLTVSDNTVRCQIHYVFNPTVGTGHTFTLDRSGGFPSCAVLAVSGSASSPFDQQNGGTATGTSLATGSVTATENNELLVAGYAEDNTISNLAIDNGFTKQEEVAYSAGNHFGCALGYLIQGTAAAINPSWSWTTSRAAAARIATFKAAAVTTIPPNVNDSATVTENVTMHMPIYVPLMKLT